jgi:hypothetical protein
VNRLQAVRFTLQLEQAEIAEFLRSLWLLLFKGRLPRWHISGPILQQASPINVQKIITVESGIRSILLRQASARQGSERTMRSGVVSLPRMRLMFQLRRAWVRRSRPLVWTEFTELT